MTPHQRKVKNALEREYLADLHARRLRVSCPTCGAPSGRVCIFLDGPRQGKPMAGTHGERGLEANRRGYVKGPWYWRVRKR